MGTPNNGKDGKGQEDRQRNVALSPRVWWGPRDVGNDTFGIRCGPMTMIRGDADDSRHRFLAIGLRYDLRQMPGVMPNSRRNTLAR